jgi:uncharacterized protein (DUF1501 family)
MPRTSPHPLGRRDLLRLLPAAGAAATSLGWGDAVARTAADLRRRGKSCILLWMQGGPSQFETFSPLEGHANGGGTKAIATSVPGMHFAEHWPEAAKVADRLAVIRSMTSKEGSHPRASYLLHTGYLPNPTARHPTLGSIVASQLVPMDDAATGDLPPVVRIGSRGRNDSGAGLLGLQWEPFEIRDAAQDPAHTSPQVPADRHLKRLDLMDRLAAGFARDLPREAEDHRAIYRRATRMILSPDMAAFDLDGEPEAVRAEYGPGSFAAGCLLARRLVEHRVPFVEVVSAGWDTHQDNFAKVAELAGQVDRPLAALVRDLERRGLLADTLVIWMGEFGRTPQVNPRGGRDHFPRSFNAVLAGGGVGGGRVIGRTDPAGVDVADRPVTVPDLFATFCRSLGIDPAVENRAPAGRPIKLVDGGTEVAELFSA